MAPSPKIMIFWDLDTCPPPQMPACEILKRTREFMRSLGVVTNIKVYWNSKNGKANKDDFLTTFRTELLLSGISAVDGSLIKGADKDAVTRMLTADILIAVLDQFQNRRAFEKIKVIIMSADNGILYPVSLLRSRAFEVYLVVPDERRLSNENQMLFRNAATELFTWNDINSPKPLSANQVQVTKSQNNQQEKGSGGHIHTEVSTTDKRESKLPLPPSPSTPPLVNGRNTTQSSPKRTTSEPAQPQTSPVTRSPHERKLSTSTGSAPAVVNSATAGKNPQPANKSPALSKAQSTEGQAQRTARGRKYPARRPKSAEAVDIMLSPDKAQVQNVIAKEWGIAPKGPNEPLNESVTIPPYFQPLVRILQEARKEGRESVSRAVVGGLLSKIKEVYAEAGVEDFRGYISRAQENRLVVAGGTGPTCWVALGPAIREK